MFIEFFDARVSVVTFLPVDCPVYRGLRVALCNQLVFQITTSDPFGFRVVTSRNASAEMRDVELEPGEPPYRRKGKAFVRVSFWIQSRRNPLDFLK